MSRTRATQNIPLTSVDALFGLEEAATTPIGNENGIIELPVDELHTFRQHPFKVSDDESMQELIESIRENGILVPFEVRPRTEGGYEIISGHRRKFAALQVDLQTVPCIISTVDDDTAILRMVDSNLYRTDILPSEKAFSYKMRMDAIKRKSGRPSKDNASQVGTQKRSDQIMAEQTGESRNQIARYIRLTLLSSKLLELVDAKKIPINVGVAVSYLDEMQQIWLFEFIRDLGNSPSLAQAEKLKKYHSERKLTKEVMEVIITEDNGASPSISIKTKVIEKFFPPNTSKQEMEETILKLLEYHMNNRA